MKPIVLLESLANTPKHLEQQFSKAFSTTSLGDAFEKAKAIFIKPNLTYPTYKKGVTTRKDFVEALISALRKINERTLIYIGEGEGGYNSYSMTNAMTTMGYFDLEMSCPNVKIVNLSQLPSRQVTLQANGTSYLLNLPELFFDEIDFSITCPLPKVHCMTKITLSLKNQWGCLPDTMRLKNHYVFNEIIGQLCEKLKFRYAFLDGKFGLDENGPMTGEAVELNWFVASNSLGAFDVVVSEMMGFDWRRIRHLKAAAKLGLIPQRKNIEIIGNIDSFKRKFTLQRSFWNYPALFAFHSSALTHFFYLSKWSKILHDIMYTFRKRPIGG
jgi:Uncharacterized conserved protein